jgi:hypothetical protein
VGPCSTGRESLPWLVIEFCVKSYFLLSWIRGKYSSRGSKAKRRFLLDWELVWLPLA